MQNSDDKIIGYSVAIYTVLLLLVLIFFGYTPYPDSEGYIYCAQESLKHNQFYPFKEGLYELPFLWNIGAINAVAASLWLFNSVTPLLVVYTLMKGFSLLLTYKIALTCFGKRTACIACVMYMLYPANYGEGTSLHSEVPFVFFTLSAVWSSLKGRYVLSGLLFGCADYIRPFALIFIMAVILQDMRNYKAYLRMLAVYAAFIVSIGLSNYCSKGEFVYKAKTGWMALSQYHWDHDSEKTTSDPQCVTGNDKLTYTQKDELWKDMFIDWLKDNKLEYIRQIPVKIFNTYVSDNIGMCTFLSKEEKQSQYMYQSLSLHALIRDFPHYSAVQWLTVVNLLFYYAVMIVFVLSIKYIKELRLQWLVIILGTLFIAFVGHGESRFHIPFMPFVIMASSYYISKMWMMRSE